MDNITEYIKPELLILVPVLVVIGLFLKETEKVNDKYIPAILGAAGEVLSALYVSAVSEISLMGIFTAITQGVLVAGAAVYVDQIAKQAKK